jgi:hypothetical protein
MTSDNLTDLIIELIRHSEEFLKDYEDYNINHAKLAYFYHKTCVRHITNPRMIMSVILDLRYNPDLYMNRHKTS